MSARRPVAAAWIALLGTTGGSCLADYQAGFEAYQAGDFATAMAQWRATAREEPEADQLVYHREALYGLGMLYWKGEGVEPDLEVAAVWLKQAAEINHAGAQVKLGYLYSTGQGVPQNYAEARRWLLMAARQGDADAQYNLGLVYRDGLGVAADEEEAMRWFAEAAANGDAQAARIVGQGAASATASTGTSAQPGSPGPGDAGEQWLLDRNPGHYTIQVIALSRPEKLHDFIAGQPAWAPFAIYRQTRYENPLWVLVQGDYPDVQAARAAAERFPPGLQNRGELWIRRFSMIQRLVEVPPQ
jgi:septal ring-binding cell division protein DamX